MRILRWIVAERHNDKLCLNIAGKTRDSTTRDLRDYLKHFEGLSLDNDFVRIKGISGSLGFKRGNRTILIKKYYHGK